MPLRKPESKILHHGKRVGTRPWRIVALLLVLQPGLLTSRRAAPSQVQIARQFLMAILRADYPRAYQLLAPEVNGAVTLRQFEVAARPLYEQGQRFGPAFDLYKLGFRLSSGASRSFYTFSFKSDTAQARPRVLLDVTFRDSAATRVLTFSLIPVRQSRKP